MGQSNICVNNPYEGLFYVDWDNFKVYDENEQEIDEPELQVVEWRFALELFKEEFNKKYPSFKPCDIWIDRQNHAVLESDFFYIAVADNEWSMAVQLLQKEPEDTDHPNYTRSRQMKFHQIYLNGIRDCLFSQFDKLGTYAGPYTHGTIKRP